MVAKKLVITLATGMVFGSGVVAAALAAGPPVPSETTTSTQTTTTATTPSTTTGTDTSTTTQTAPTTSTEQPSTAAGTTTAPRPSTSPPSSAPRATTRRQARTVPREPTRSDRPTVTGRPASPHRRKHRHRKSKPLEVTPPLGLDGYVFPVVGVSGYGDSYGVFRGDVHGKWHHGDDIFAPLGAPVVAVADGTINRVGWRKLGGWRLWVRDTAANQFYYAHLSGYAPRVFHSRHVRAGDILGFVGTTGDAFGGAPHLHFEVHPHQLLRLRYDGAVDPTTYLDSWERVRAIDAPFPVHPRLPRRPLFRREARVVFRQLLVARHLIVQPATPIQQPAIVRAEHRGVLPLPELLSLRNEPVSPAASAGSTVPTGPLLAALLIVAVFVAMTVLATIVLGRSLRSRGSEVS